MAVSTISEIVAAMFSLFTYTTDLEQYGVFDDQRSHVASVKAGKKFKDDCDGFALTAVELLQKIRVDSTTMVVRKFGGDLHMITVFIDPDTKELMVLDNDYFGLRTFKQAAEGSRYKDVFGRNLWAS